MKSYLVTQVEEIISAAQSLGDESALFFMESAAQKISECYERDGKLLIAGNGGSLCDAQHFAEELTGYFCEDRPALSAIALSDPGHMSCVANDTSFDEVFARGVEAHGRAGDLFVALTTSGNSKNIIKAVEMARKKDLEVISFLGKGGGLMKGLSDLEFVVPYMTKAERIQEVHMAVIHLIIDLVEKQLFNPSRQGELLEVHG